MGALIDSSVLIDAERGKLDLAELNTGHGRETLSISAITASAAAPRCRSSDQPVAKGKAAGFC
jgi:tRNA(fMet)-specific endonuclease VapC